MALYGWYGLQPRIKPRLWPSWRSSSPITNRLSLAASSWTKPSAMRPGCRRKGYASRMLELLIVRAREAGLNELHISVERENLPSVRVIQGRGGAYERSFTHEGMAADIYVIAL